jgi:hypothetical protein
VRSISNPPADVCLGGGFDIDVSAAAIMKIFEQISDEVYIKNKLTVFNCFIIIIFLFCLMKMEYSVTFCIQSGKEKRWPPKFVRHGQFYINLGNVFAECVHFLFSRISLNLSLSLCVCVVCWRIKCSLSKQEIMY